MPIFPRFRRSVVPFALAVLVTGYHSGVPSQAQTLLVEPAVPHIEQSPGQRVTRSIALTEIGLESGARLAGLGASRDFYFPVPRGLKASAVLNIEFEAASALKNRRSIEVLAGERSLVLKPLAGLRERETLRLPLTQLDSLNGFVKVSVRYGQALPDDRCIDIRFAGDHLTILPETSLQLTFDAQAVESVASALSLMPDSVTIYLPGRELDTREFAAALETARSLRDSGRRIRFESLPGADATSRLGHHQNRFSPLTTLAFVPHLPVDSGASVLRPVAAPAAWTQGSVIIASNEDLDRLAGNLRNPLFRGDGKPSVLASGLSVVNFGVGPAILVTGPDPQGAAKLIGSAWSAAAVKGSVTTQGSIISQRVDGRVTFDNMRTDLSARDVVDRAQWNVSLASRDLPPRRKLTGLRLHVAVAPDEANSNAVVTAFFNERMMQSVATANDMRAQLAFDIPQGLAGLSNSLRVVVQRQPQGGDCAALASGFPAQLLGSSEVLTGPAAEAPSDFFEISSLFRDGVTVFVESRSAFGQRAHLAMLTELAGNLVPAGAPLALRFLDSDEAARPDGPFVAISARTPEHAVPPVRFDQGRAIIRGPEGATIADLGGLRNTAVAQLVRAGLNQGVWIRPAVAEEDLTPPTQLALDRGNVAVIDRNGVAFAYSSERDRLVEVIYPDKRSLADIAGAYRPWVVGALWLAFSLLIVMSVHRFYERGRRGRA